MRRVTWSLRACVILVAALATALLFGAADAHMNVALKADGSYNVVGNYQLPCGSAAVQIVPNPPNPYLPGLPGFHETHGVPPNPRVILSAISVLSGGNYTLYEAAYALGGACAGGDLQTEALPPDTLAASVGLYPPGGGFPDTTRMLHYAVIRTAGNVRLKYLGGGMEVGPQSSLMHNNAEVVLKMAVYPNQAAADADVNEIGAGASFFGRAELAGPNGTLLTSGGFTQSDWVVSSSDGTGRSTATMNPAFVKDVAVADANAAVVSLIGDPHSLTQTPGQTPVGLILLAIALMVAGFGIIHTRRRVTIA
jgi:hypothetical protein